MKGAIMRVVYTVFTTVFTYICTEGVYIVFTVFTYEDVYSYTVFTHEGIYAFTREEHWRTKDWRRTFREECASEEHDAKKFP